MIFLFFVPYFSSSQFIAIRTEINYFDITLPFQSFFKIIFGKKAEANVTIANTALFHTHIYFLAEIFKVKKICA